MLDPWILHEHFYAPCGCGIVASLYHDIEGDKYAHGQNRVTLIRCANHPSMGDEIDHVANAEPEPDLDWDEPAPFLGMTIDDECSHQWCEFHHVGLDDPTHDYIYVLCERYIRDATPREDALTHLAIHAEGP
jgi:hypothetical protein